MQRGDITHSVSNIVLIVIAFVLGGTGIGVLYNSKGDLISIIGGFTLIGIAVAIIYKLLQDG